MNEPITVGGGLLTLSLLAGTKTEIDATGKVTCKNVLDLPEAKHVALSGTVLWPATAAGNATLFGTYTVPPGQILIVDYVSLFNSIADESSSAIEFGINANVATYWQYTIASGITRLGQATGAQNVFNRPCFLVFPSGSIPAVIIGDSTAQVDESRRLLATANAWQCSENLYEVFRRYQSVFAV